VRDQLAECTLSAHDLLSFIFLNYLVPLPDMNNAMPACAESQAGQSPHCSEKDFLFLIDRRIFFRNCTPGTSSLVIIGLSHSKNRPVFPSGFAHIYPPPPCCFSRSTTRQPYLPSHCLPGSVVSKCSYRALTFDRTFYDDIEKLPSTVSLLQTKTYDSRTYRSF